MANGSYGKCAGCGAMVIWGKNSGRKEYAVRSYVA